MPTYNNALETYTRNTFAIEDHILTHIREQATARGLPPIAIKPEEGRFLQFLVASCGAKRALEIGTLAGYSGVWIARGLLPGGRLITLEKKPEHAAVAREHFKLAGVDELIDVRVGNAHDLMADLSAEGIFDFLFIDAEKGDYPAYLDWALSHMRPGGVIAAHNAFRHGAIVDPTIHKPDTEAMLTFNQRLATEPRLIATIFPAGDGIAIAVVRPD